VLPSVSFRHTVVRTMRVYVSLDGSHESTSVLIFRSTTTESTRMNPRITKIIKHAKRRGHLKYTTGKACKSGHVAERWVSNKTCVICENRYNKTWRDRQCRKR
jgi:hypothetical protein